MLIFVISFVVIALAFAGLAIGVMLGRQPIKGSCGGLARTGISGSCEVCGGEPSRCDAATAEPRA